MNALRWLLCVGCALFLLFAVHMIDVENRIGALRRFLSDRTHSIDQIVEEYGVARQKCSIERRGGLYPLAMAFLTIENFSTPRLEKMARVLFVHTTGLIGLAPDISIGPARIRLSTARTVLNSAKSTAMRRYGSISPQALAQRLLDLCDSIRVAVAILEDIQRQDRDSSADIDRTFVRFAAGTYNGQSANTNSVEARLSAEVYLELVYAAFQHYRFQAL